jgi:hypothetical protein
MTDTRQHDHHARVRAAVLDEATFLRLTVSGRLQGAEVPWIKAVVRPVLVRGQRRMQFSYFDGRKDITKNFAGDDVAARLDELLALPFSQLLVQSTAGDLHVRITKRGRVLIGRGKPSRAESAPDLSHDRVKAYPLPANTPDALLQAVGIMDRNGRVRATMQGKFHQINEFLTLMQQMLEPSDFAAGPLQIADCGCGNAYLTFGAYHSLNHLRGLPAHVVGVDRHREIIEKCDQLRTSLGWEGMEFHVARIAEFAPETRPDVVLSLHACDTATDEALAQGILWASRVILAAPCCQHELQSQLKAPLFRPVLRHGILKQRLGDILTDAFRALVLRIMGYRTDVVQFVSPEHTSKNLMIRARKGLKPGDKASLRQYQELKSFWGVRPILEEMLGEQFRQLLCHSS